LDKTTKKKTGDCIQIMLYLSSNCLINGGHYIKLSVKFHKPNHYAQHEIFYLFGGQNQLSIYLVNDRSLFAYTKRS
jgi:hypothetical protein